MVEIDPPKEHCVTGSVPKLVRRGPRKGGLIENVFFPLETIDGYVVFFRVPEHLFHLLTFDLTGRGEGYKAPVVKIANPVKRPLISDLFGYTKLDYYYEFTEETVVKILTNIEVMELPKNLQPTAEITAMYIDVKSDWSDEKVLLKGTECRVHRLVSIDGEKIFLNEYRHTGEMAQLCLDEGKAYDFYCIKSRGKEWPYDARGFNFAVYSFVKMV